MGRQSQFAQEQFVARQQKEAVASQQQMIQQTESQQNQSLTNVCLEDGGCQDLPGHSSKNHVKIPSKICRRYLLLRCSPVSISTLKNDLFCFVRVNSVAFSAPLLRWRKIPKYMALHV